VKRAVEILPVGRLVTYIQDYLEASPLLQDLWVEGEVSNCSRSPSGHVFFTLKDAQGQVRCVLFRGQITSRTILPENGAHIIVHGRLSFYEANGHLQLYVDQVYPVGTGLLWLEFERLRDRLAREGLFDPSRKRPLPRFPRRIGIVTSPAWAVLHDMLTILRRRFPLVEVVLAPALVQGEVAAESKRLHPGARVVLVTGWPVDLPPEELNARGLDALLPKPCTLDDVGAVTHGCAVVDVAPRA